jgi:AcrR family transcriptional regulator
MSISNKPKNLLKQLPQDQRLGYIAETARTLFSDHGYDVTTMDKIAQKLGIGRTTLYDYFQSKDDMLYYLIDQRIDLDEHIPLEGHLVDQLQQLMVASLTRFKDNFVLYKILFTEKPAFANQTTNKLLQWQQRVLTTVAQVLEQGITSKQITPRCSVTQMVFVFQALLGQRMSHLLLGSETSLEPEKEVQTNQEQSNPGASWIQREAESLTDLMIHGIGDIT